MHHVIHYSFSPSHQQKHSLLEWLYSLAYVSSGYPDLLESILLTPVTYQAIKDISASYDALIDLFESFENFLRRLDIYTKIPSTTAMSEIVVKILIELLSTIALAVQQAKQGRLSEPRPFR